MPSNDAVEEVLFDEGLLSFATKAVSRALSLEGANRTLGRKFVRLSLEAPDFEAFAKKSQGYGAIGDGVLKDLYNQSQKKLKAISQSSHSHSNSNGDFTTDGQVEYSKDLQVEMDKPSEINSMKGGLMVTKSEKSTKSNSNSNSSNRGGGSSLLGLDKLAQKKRDEAAMKELNSVGSVNSVGGRNSTSTDTDTDRHRSNLNHRQYRQPGAETPSIGGGVNVARQEQILARSNQIKQRETVIGGSSRRRSRSRSPQDDRDRYRRHDNDRDRDRDMDRRNYGDDRRDDRRDYDRRDDRRGYDRKDDRGSRDNRRGNSRSPDRDRVDRDRDRRDRGDRDRRDRSRSRERDKGGKSLPPPSSSSTYSSSGRTSTAHTESTSSTSNAKNEWDFPTPAVGGGGASSTSSLGSSRGSTSRAPSSYVLGSTPRQTVSNKAIRRAGFIVDDSPEPEYTDNDEADDDYDRNFYLSEEGPTQGDEAGEGFLGSKAKFKEREDRMSRDRAKGDVKRAGMSAKKSQVHADQEAWEDKVMLQSGVSVVSEARTVFDSEEDSRVTLIVHNLRPPFLDSGTEFSLQQSTVSTIRDHSSDMAVNARKGSKSLKENRERREMMKMRKKFWELGGSKMGNIIGVEAPDEEETEKVPEAKEVGGSGDKMDEDEDFKADGTFAKHMKKNEAQSEFAKTKTMRQQREFLPVYAVKDELLNIVRENQVTIIVGETGSGKTTQLTQYLHESGFTEFGKIGCTQPRRVAAMSVAKRVAEEMDVTLGDECGYAIRFEDMTSEKTVIKYMTDGVLLRESLREPDLDQYSCIVMDEAHERSLHTDVLFGILKKIVSRRRDMKLIVTSATLNAERFSSFFGGVPVFHIPGRTFHVDTYYAKVPPDDYVEAAVKQALTIHLSNPTGDILIFMTGQEDIEATCDMIAERIGELGDKVPPLLLLPMYSQLPADLQAKIFQCAESGQRKCIVSTNIAETSLTVDGIKYVIDSGYNKLKVYNPKIGMDALQLTPESQANANQRKGRAGRTGPGYCYRLYTERQYVSDLMPNQVPEIQRTNLSNVVLLLKSLGVDDLLSFDFMDPPPQENISNSMYQLWVLGALNNSGNLTELGRKMVEFPLDPPLAKMLIFAEKMGVTQEILIVVSMLSVPGVFFRPKDREEESDAAREKFFVPESDHLTFLNVYTQWKQKQYSASWCNDHFIHPKGMKKAREVHQQLLDIMKTQKVQHLSSGGDWDIVRKAICSSYFYNSARIKGVGEYVNMLTGIPSALHPSSALFGLGYTPDYVCYHELIMTQKEYMSCVTAVEGEWLAEMGPMFFSVKNDFGSKKAPKVTEETGLSAVHDMSNSTMSNKNFATNKGTGSRQTMVSAGSKTPKPLSGGSRTPRRKGFL